MPSVTVLPLPPSIFLASSSGCLRGFGEHTEDGLGYVSAHKAGRLHPALAEGNHQTRLYQRFTIDHVETSYHQASSIPARARVPYLPIACPYLSSM